MVSYNILILFVVFNVFVEFIESFPTFGDEFVHIKVHLPDDPSSSRGILKPKQEPGSSQLRHHTDHKVIHHFHRRRKPFRKLPKIEADPLLENVLLAELDNPINDQSYQHEAKNNIEPTIHETYVIKAEHHNKPAATKVNTYTVIEETLNAPNYNHYKESHQPHPEYGIGNIKNFKIIEEHNTQKQYQPKHVELVKLIEEKPYYPQHQQHITKENYIKYQHNTPEKTKYNISYESTEAEEEEEKNYYPEEHTGQDDNEYYKSQQQEPLEIVKTITAIKNGYGRPCQESSFENYHGQDYFENPLQETLEIIKTKKPEKYHYETEMDYNYHQPEEDIVQIKETQYSIPKDEYYQYRATPEEDHHFNKPSPTKPFNLHNIKNYETGYRYNIPSTTQLQSSHAHDYIPAVPAERNPQQSLSYTQYEERPHNYQKLVSTAMKESTLYDELGTSSVYRPGTAEETYTGYDSYSAAHVQGVGSGGYQFPLAYS